MSLETGKKIVRVLSAKATKIQVQKTRPLSGVSPLNFTRKQLIENVYNSQSSDFRRVVSARQPNNNFISQNLEQNRQIRKASIGKTKQKEEMASQILILKQTINKLVEQLSHQKGKVESMRKKNLKYSKILTMEYQDQKQWDSHALSNHLVVGIKNMYDNLKQKYEEKCRQFELILKKQSITNILERDELIKALEQQTKQLKVKIQKMNEKNIFSAYTETQKQASQEINKDLKFKLKVMEEKNHQTDKIFKEFVKKIKDLQHKVELDKRLLIEKDNTNHFLEKKIKQITKQITKTKQLNIILDKQLQETKSLLENERQKHEKLVIQSAQQLKQEKQILTRSKDVKIQSLQQDNSYLNKMIQDLRSTNLQLNKTNQQLKELNSKNFTKIFRDTTVENLLNNKLNIDNKSSNHQREEKPLKPLNQKGKRIPQRANQKYHETATKTRKIDLKEILQIAQLIRYKLIAQQFSIQKVKCLFNFNPQNQLNGQQFQWCKQYIKMQEVKQIFKSLPFQLQQDDATAISRYLIEDVQEQFVFCDDMNENHREVIKSIVKTLIQDYPVYSSGCQEYSEVKQVTQRYRTNLKSAMKSLTKETQIPKSKLIEGMKSIGFEASDHIMELILAKIALKSKKLSLLQYSSVF